MLAVKVLNSFTSKGVGSIDAPFTLGTLRKVRKGLLNQEMLSSLVEVLTFYTDDEETARKLPGFVPVEHYDGPFGCGYLVEDGEIGRVEHFRLVKVQKKIPFGGL